MDFGGTLARPGPDPDGRTVAAIVRATPGTLVPEAFADAFDAVHRAVRQTDRARETHTPFAQEIRQAARACGARVPDPDAAADAVFSAIPDAHVDQGAAEALRLLHRRGLVCVLACDTQRPAWVRRRTLEAEGIADLFDALVLSSALGVRKPNPAFYRAVIEACGCPAQEALFVGDTPSKDVLAPHALGMQAVLISLSGRPDGMEESIGVLPHLRDLPHYLETTDAL
ncbi:hypothetical protein BJF83_20260 [Nocardiopsis sp. CNR-923]|nr:hypothetical protein BJF83_20260 [Nocardiopsis sp. CNR-923]